MTFWMLQEECERHVDCEESCAFFDKDAGPRGSCVLKRPPSEWDTDDMARRYDKMLTRTWYDD